MTSMTVVDLQRIERYLDAVPRTAAEPVEVGPFTLFRPTSISTYYARPRLGDNAVITARDVELLAERCRALALPLAIEGTREVTPSLIDAVRDAGLHVTVHPLLALPRDAAPTRAPAPTPAVGPARNAGISCRRLEAGDPDAARAHAVAQVAFGAGGTSIGPEGTAERDAAARHVALDRVALIAARGAAGHTVTIAGYLGGHGVVSVAHHQPMDGCSEIVGVATLPAFRRRGLAGAVTAAAIEDAFTIGVDLLILSAADDDVARGYERLGFVRVGHAVAAERAT